MYGSMTPTTQAQSKLSVVQEKGQVTIPSEIREKLGLKKGDYVAFVETDQGILITPREVVAMEALEKISRVLKEQGISLEDLMQAGRDNRETLIEEEYGLKFTP